MELNEELVALVTQKVLEDPAGWGKPLPPVPRRRGFA